MIMFFSGRNPKKKHKKKNLWMADMAASFRKKEIPSNSSKHSSHLASGYKCSFQVDAFFFFEAASWNTKSPIGVFFSGDGGGGFHQFPPGIILLPMPPTKIFMFFHPKKSQWLVEGSKSIQILKEKSTFFSIQSWKPVFNWDPWMVRKNNSNMGVFVFLLRIYEDRYHIILGLHTGNISCCCGKLHHPVIPCNDCIQYGPKTGVIILPTQTMHHLGEIPQNNHTFEFFDSPQMGNLMIPVRVQNIG